MNHQLKSVSRLTALYLCALALSGCLSQQSTSPQQNVAEAIPKVNIAKPPTEIHPSAMNFADALQRTRNNSAKLRADQADVAAKALQREAIEGINLPWLSISGTAARYSIHADISTEKVQQRIDALGAQIDGVLGQLPPIPGLPPPPDFSNAGNILPDSIHLHKKDNYTNAALSVIWPAYSGGRLGAVKDFVGARASEAQSTLRTTEDTLYSTLVERYFGTQLAILAESVRAQAVSTIAKHDHMAQRFLDEGLIARNERLEASAKLAEAKDNLEAAENKSKLATAGLARLVGANMAHPATALFVNTNALKPLDWYQQQALEHFPGFAKIDAKEQQVEAMRTFSEAAFKPTINVLGRHDIKAHDANWLIGVNVRYTLFSGVDRSKMIKAANIQLDQVQAVREQAQSDIQLLVEKNWLSVQDALARFASYDAQMALAREQTRLASRSFAEGLATALDAIDADTNLARVRTERAQAAYDYVLALSQLLESAGIPETFIDYQVNADVHIDEATL
ncbi:TolC family protein [Cardiobacteriaceae bacterium TAE3-ERU3]|nr:TolC family protein [Cardiobacteriaceae bacterium TAE3-ERU3]